MVFHPFLEKFVELLFHTVDLFLGHQVIIYVCAEQGCPPFLLKIVTYQEVPTSPVHPRQGRSHAFDIGGPKQPKSVLALFASNIGGPRPPRPTVRLRPC